jgi:lipoprotein-anchoring transpeptidase ErfK/SrfK
VKAGSFIVVAIAVLALFGGALGLYAYDSSRDDLIAEGVTVADIDVGGMRADEAREVLRQEVSAPLERPVEISYGRRRFELTPERAKVRTDLGGMVDEAVRLSREGNLISRTWRDLTGAREAADVEPRVSYSRGAVRRLVRRLAARIDRPAQDAKVSFSTGSLGHTEARTGRELKAGSLRRKIGVALQEPVGERTIKAPVKVTKPKVTSEELADRHPVVLTVDRGSFTLRIFKRLKLRKSYRIAVGQAGLETPAGLYHIQNKGVNVPWNVPDKAWAGPLAGKTIPGGAPDNPLKARWMGIYDGAGIHGTDDVGSLGSAASHGCIRMAIPDVKELYSQVAVQTPVYIA